MAHGGSGDDNPVSLNVAPMVDIIFCLCLFFMCSLHFKQLEGKFESWLPKHGGPEILTTPPPLEEIRVSMRWNEAEGRSEMRVGARPVASDEEMWTQVRERLDRYEALGLKDTRTVIDAESNVAWSDVIGVMDTLKRHRVEKIELAAPLAEK